MNQVTTEVARKPESSRNAPFALALGTCVAVVVAVAFFTNVFNEERPRPKVAPIVRADGKPLNSFQAITGGDTDDEKSRWNALLKTNRYVYGKEPTEFLRDNLRMLPIGKVLVLPMEEGRNAVFLARNGFQVEGVDYSDVALQKAKRLARDNGVSVTGINADLNEYVIPRESYDVIVNINFHRKRVAGQIKQALKRGGIVLYESYTVDQLANISNRSARRDYMLERGELRELFKDFEVITYRETNDGKRAVASLVARKP